MNHLLAETLRFLEENFSLDTSWAVPPAQIHLRKEPVKKPPVKEPSSPIKQQASPIQVENPIKQVVQPTLSLTIEKEPAPTVEAPALNIENLSQAVKNLFPEFTTRTAPFEEKDLKIDLADQKLLQAPVVLFSFREGRQSDLFLNNIRIAIESYFFPAAVLDAKKWELTGKDFSVFFKNAEAKIFLSSETLYQKKLLLPFIKEIPVSSERFLGNGKLLMLSPFETYFQNPLQKKELWKSLCATLKNLPLPPSS